MPSSFLVARVHDLRTLLEHTFVLGETDALNGRGDEVYWTWIGRATDDAPFVDRDGDPAVGRNVLVLDDPAIEPLHVHFWEISGHVYATAYGPGVAKFDPGAGECPVGETIQIGPLPFRVGPFALEIFTPSDPPPRAWFGPAPAGLPARLGPGARPVSPPDDATDAPPSAAAAGLHALATTRWLEPDDALAALSPAARAWCVDQLERHVALLSRATEPRPRLPAPEVVFEQSFDAAHGRWDAAWRTVEGQPFVPEAWAYLHRLGCPFGLESKIPDWQAPHGSGSARLGFSSRFLEAFWVFAHEADRWIPNAPSPARDYGRCDLPKLAWAEFIRNPGLTGGAPRETPWTPLLEMWRRGAWPMALPGRQMLVYVPSRSQPRAAPALVSPSRRRTQPPARPESSPAIATHDAVFNAAPWMHPAASAPAPEDYAGWGPGYDQLLVPQPEPGARAWLEVLEGQIVRPAPSDGRIVLPARTTLGKADTETVVLRGDSWAQLTQVGRTFWIQTRYRHEFMVNGGYVGEKTACPLYDHDLLKVPGSSTKGPDVVLRFRVES